MNKFEINGVHHLALVCKDMERTVEFYTDVLGMRLTKGFDLEGYGQHFFFDMGNGSELGFFGSTMLRFLNLALLQLRTS